MNDVGREFYPRGLGNLFMYRKLNRIPSHILVDIAGQSGVPPHEKGRQHSARGGRGKCAMGIWLNYKRLSHRPLTQCRIHSLYGTSRAATPWSGATWVYQKKSLSWTKTPSHILLDKAQVILPSLAKYGTPTLSIWDSSYVDHSWMSEFCHDEAHDW